jgi:hypothetical protein
LAFAFPFRLFNGRFHIRAQDFGQRQNDEGDEAGCRQTDECLG